MRCPSCGKRNPDEFKFCGYCGQALARAPLPEKRWVTTLFFDLTNFSRYTASNDLENTHQVVSGLLQKCRSCVHNHGGYVDKFFGDGMLAVFGAKISRENEPLSALKAAACMVEETSRGGRRSELVGRVGIATGVVLIGPLGGEEQAHQTVLGGAVNLAQRLSASAPAGEIWLDEETAKLIPEAHLLKLKPRLFKGFDKEAPVWSFSGWKEHKSVIVGREQELRDLLRLLRTGFTRGGALITVSGEVGIGKTTLAKEAMSQLGDSVKSIFIPSLQSGDSVRETLRTTFAENFGVSQDSFFDSLGLGDLDRALLSYALGLTKRPPAPLGTLDEAVVRALRNALTILAGKKPLFIVVRSGSRDHPLLRSMLSSLREKPIPGLCVLVLNRQKSEHTDIFLQPLDGDRARDYLRLLNPQMPAERAKEVIEESRGNPLALRFMALSGNSSGGVLAAFQSRLDRLPRMQQQALLLAALGRPYSWLGVLQDLLGPHAADAVSQLAQEGYINYETGAQEENSKIEVANPLLSTVAEQILPKHKQKLGHAAYWRWLSANGGDDQAAVAAEHAVLAGLDEEAGESWIRSAHYHRSGGIFSGAERYFRLAMEKGGPHSRLRAKKLLADLYLRVGRLQAAVDLLANEDSAWARRTLGLALAQQGDAKAEDLLLEALAMDPDDTNVRLALSLLRPAPERIKLLLSLLENADARDPIYPSISMRLAGSYAELGEIKKAIEYMENAFHGFSDHGNESRSAEAALALSGYMWWTERLPAALAWAEQAVNRSQKNHPGLAIASWSVRAGLLLDSGRPNEAAAALRQAELHEDHARNLEEWARIHAIRIRFLIETGNLSQAITLGESAFDKHAHPWLAANLVFAYSLAGRYKNEEAADLRRRYTGHSSPHVQVLLALAAALQDLRDGENARAALKAALRHSKNAGPYLRYVTLILWGISLLQKDPHKTSSLAHYLQNSSSRSGFVSINETARLLRAESDLRAGKDVSHLLRFRASLPVLEAWRSSLLLRAKMSGGTDHPHGLSGYGILGVWAKLVNSPRRPSGEDGSSRRNP